ncbi:RHS repeat domain-containing protein [Pedobacter flavus]|uniref:RHS repeat domain-containing protein n=1 Tax=Pedobacter flavus TaxID=3113906 RepID=A0ABU7H442_9SPHI|nr:RHS repeat domain-containing protein [Pedobacter sp. VNH31]MEE1885361.1 RHS repeat domain-containing protein [Pedobacter sp. VNH31]
MKTTITLLLILFTSIATFAQNIDWINAPLNPVPQGMDLKYQHLKGDVMQGSILNYFTRDGKWFSYRGNEKLKKDAQGRIIEYTDEKGTARTYQYDSKGNLINSSGSIYEYDNKNRLIKANHKYETSQYSYKNQGDLLIITELNTFDGKTSELEHHYKNGLRILQKSSGGTLKYEYTFDAKGNWVSMTTIDAATNKTLLNQYTGKPLKPTVRNIIYYSDYDKGLSAITVQLIDLTEGRVANAPLIPHPFFNGKELEKQMIARLIDDYVFYEPLAKTYYIARNAFLKTNKVGQKIPVEILISGVENILLYNGKYIGVVEKGNKGEDENDWKTINYTETLSSFVSVHQKTGSAYAFENIPKISNGKTVAIVGKSIPDFWYATINNKNGIYVFKNGLALNLKSISGYLANSKTQDLIVAVEGGTEYILPDYENSVDKKFYKARLFNPATDKIQTQKSSSSNTTPATTKTTSSNTSEQTTETRYYNGRYDYDNGLSSKEVVLHKINSYINIKNKAGATFLKLEEKQDFLSGTWTIKSSQGNIVIALDYLIGDKSLTVKLKYLMVGSQVISKNHPKGEMRNLHNVAIENFILDLFKYLEIKNNTTSKQTTTTTASSNTLEQTTETRYYNGKYTKETALQKANDFFNRTNGEKITFTKMEKKSDYLFVGNWIIKGADESLQSKIEYSFEDDGLKIKINEIVLNDKYGTLKMDKNHKDEAVRKTAENLYTSINDLYVKAVFVHLDINNNTLKKTTKTGSNTSGQSIEKDYSKDKITASYNENLSLYVRKINDATVYFYQDNSRINQPIHYEIIEDGKNLRLFTTYTKDYYSAFSLNDMSTDKLYPLTHRNGVFYLYIYKKNGTYSFTYQGKALHSAQYELYISKGDYTVVKVKSDNTIYLFKSDLSKAAISNSQAKGVLVHFADKNPIFVEAGKPTEPTKWKIEKENDKYYLINSSENKKHGVTDYEKSINWGIYTIN